MRPPPGYFDLRRRQLGTIAGVAAYAALAGAGLSVLAARGADPVAVAVLGVAALAVLVAVLVRTVGRTSAIARRLAADVRVVVDTNPRHRLDPVQAGELYLLAGAVNQLAERRMDAESEVRRQVDTARRELESERNRLAALMAQLSVAVIVCNMEGRILLYNDAARSLVGDETSLGLGRSVFGVLDRGLVTHALDRLGAGSEPVVATTLHGSRMVRVRTALVRDGDAGTGAPRGSGVVLILEDLTRQLRAADRKDQLLRRLTERTRASLGSIRAAVESVLEFPDLTAQERRTFLEIVREEADSLGRRVDEWASESAHLDDDRVPTDIAGHDLLEVLTSELGRASFAASADPAPDDLWLRADSHLVGRAVLHLAARVRDLAGTVQLRLALSPSGRHGQLDVRWQGRAPESTEFGGWLLEPLDGAGATTARDVADRHGAEVWAGRADDGTAYLRLLLPLAEGAPDRPAAAAAPDVRSRPEFYDFDLFSARPQSPDWDGRRLDELSYTVLDTETTGLDPSAGDRIVSLAAVRVVNGRLLRQETLEQLVDPGRGVPAASSAIHGITTDMVRGAPAISEVLPVLARFAEDTVLVGHNVGFDLQFLRLAEDAAGVELNQPVLDTLLLDAAVHPDHDDHTLEAIAARLGVHVMGRHTALGDALVTGEVLVALLGVLRSRGVVTLGEAVALARDTLHARVEERRYGR